MVSKVKLRVWASILSVMLMCTGLTVNASAENGGHSLPKANWQQSMSQYDRYTLAPYHVPNTKTVYLASVTDVFSETKVWEAGVVTAVDEVTGKKKWSYTFYKKGNPYPWDTTIGYGKNGSVYALVEDGFGTKLFSVNSSGKSNWTISVPQAGELYIMNDGTIIIINPDKRDSKGNSTPWAYAYSAAGKKISEHPLGQIYSVVGGQYVVSQLGQVENSKLEVFSSKLNRLFTYNSPSGAVTYINEGAWLINKEDILIRFNLPKTGNRLIALDPKGKALWGRDIPGNATVQSVGQNYTVYADGQLSLYNMKGIVSKTSITTDDPMGTILETPDHQILMYTSDEKSIISPGALKVIYQYPYDQDMSKYYYAGNGYLYAVKGENQLAQHKL